MGKIVLIITRDYDSDVERFAEENEYLMSCVDSCGTLSVWEFGHGDFPLEVWERLEAFLIKTRGQRPPLFMRREDPGLGIVIPEIDELPGGFLNPLPEDEEELLIKIFVKDLYKDIRHDKLYKHLTEEELYNAVIDHRTDCKLYGNNKDYKFDPMKQEDMNGVMEIISDGTYADDSDEDEDDDAP